LGLSGKQWVAMALGMLIIVPTAQHLGRTLGEQQDSQSSVAHKVPFKSVGQETRVLVSRQDAEGVTNDQIDVEVADAIGAYSLQRMKFHMKTILDEMGSSDSVDTMTEGTVLVPNDGLNLVVTRFSIGEVTHSVQVAAIKGNELVRVGCISPRGDIGVTLAGKCAAALKEHFNFDVPGA
jgi:hypothetical protein